MERDVMTRYQAIRGAVLAGFAAYMANRTVWAQTPPTVPVVFGRKKAMRSPAPISVVFFFLLNGVITLPAFAQSVKITDVTFQGHSIPADGTFSFYANEYIWNGPYVLPSLINKKDIDDEISFTATITDAPGGFVEWEYSGEPPNDANNFILLNNFNTTDPQGNRTANPLSLYPVFFQGIGVNDDRQSYLFTPRPALKFRVVAILYGDDPIFGPNSYLGMDEVEVLQSDLGRLRQEYVDHPVTWKVPDIDEFTPYPHDTIYNSQHEFDWAVLPESTLNVIKDVQDIAAVRAAQGQFPQKYVPLQVTSVYRSPIKHWKVYKKLNADRAKLGQEPKAVSLGSAHLVGRGVDFQVFDFNQDGHYFGKSSDKGNWGQSLWQKDYNILAKICNANVFGYKVFPEGEVDHVHLDNIH